MAHLDNISLLHYHYYYH